MPRYGSKTHHDHHKQITESCARYTTWWRGYNSWGNKASLRQICAELDQHQIPIPERWKTGRTESLRRIGIHLNRWSDALDLGYDRLVVDQIRYSIARQRLIDAATGDGCIRTENFPTRIPLLPHWTPRPCNAVSQVRVEGKGRTCHMESFQQQTSMAVDEGPPNDWAGLLLQPEPKAVVPLIELESQAIANALAHTRGDTTLTARLLGIGRTTVYRKVKQYQLREHLRYGRLARSSG